MKIANWSRLLGIPNRDLAIFQCETLRGYDYFQKIDNKDEYQTILMIQQIWIDALDIA